MARRQTDNRFQVHRDRLVRVLMALRGLVDASGRGLAYMPADFEGTFHNVQVPARNFRLAGMVSDRNESYEDFDRRAEQMAFIPGAHTVMVYSTTAKMKDKNARYASTRRSTHRTFIVCPTCGKEIPAGRLHQHLFVGSECNK